MYESVLLEFSITNFSQNTQELQLIIFNKSISIFVNLPETLNLYIICRLHNVPFYIVVYLSKK
jgi:hypothetical protein